MIYNFDKLTNRRGTNSYKWDSITDEDVLPMWVADMDFETAPVIITALQKRLSHGIFGYTKVPNIYFKAVTKWFEKQHGWSFPEEWILYTSGVVPALSAIIKALTEPGDQIIIQEPVYNCFFSSIRNNGCEIVSNNLIYNNSTYTIDFDDLERKAAHPKAKILLLCNPHNPVGKVWSSSELAHIGEICAKHQIKVVVDEIHCELVSPDYKYTPYGSLSQQLMHNAIICNSPSKAFNIAGLQIANIICDNAETRKKIDRAININEVCDVNPFGVEALIAAYSEEGADWLKQLNNYLYDNYLYVKDFFETHLPQFPVTRLEGTYLVWINCQVTGKDSNTITQYLLNKEKVWVNEGDMYGENGKDFIRLNIACPRQRLEEGIQRIYRGLKSLML